MHTLFIFRGFRWAGRGWHFIQIPVTSLSFVFPFPFSDNKTKVWCSTSWVWRCRHELKLRPQHMNACGFSAFEVLCICRVSSHIHKMWLGGRVMSILCSWWWRSETHQKHSHFFPQSLFWLFATYAVRVRIMVNTYDDWALTGLGHKCIINIFQA